METSYGALKDKWDGIRSLATLAYAKYRDPYFRDELLVALKIIQDGHIARDKFVSSWAGAMGQTQFMPTNFVDYAVDFSGDGKRDIWTNVPDVLASTANYFRKAAGGWKCGVPWGFEVIVPKDFDLMKSRATFEEWTKLGVKRADGKSFPSSGDGILFFPTGVPGPAFIVTANYRRHQGLQQLRRLCARDRPSRRPDAGRRAVQARRGRRRPRSFRATTASPCRSGWPSSATTRSGSPRTSISRCATSSAPSRRSTAWSPTAIPMRRCWTGWA